MKLKISVEPLLMLSTFKYEYLVAMPRGQDSVEVKYLKSYKKVLKFKKDL